jgi:hypothetical protein
MRRASRRDAAGRRRAARDLARHHRAIRAMREWMAHTTTLSAIAAKAMHACRWIVRGVGMILLSLAAALVIAWMMWTWITYTVPDIDLKWHEYDVCFSRGDEMYACVSHTVECIVEDVAHNTVVFTDWIQSTIDSIEHVVVLAFAGEVIAMSGVIVGAAVVTYGVLCILAKVFCVMAAFLFPYTYRYGLSQDLV